VPLRGRFDAMHQSVHRRGDLLHRSVSSMRHHDRHLRELLSDRQQLLPATGNGPSGHSPELLRRVSPMPGGWYLWGGRMQSAVCGACNLHPVYDKRDVPVLVSGGVDAVFGSEQRDVLRSVPPVPVGRYVRELLRALRHLQFGQQRQPHVHAHVQPDVSGKRDLPDGRNHVPVCLL
jgi:hypothetical protein